ncbi:peptidoglycan DD-metalloendopeptidase family protein [Pontibacter sp. G13]|uniref:murein hydrolase activator EnvC family protein n=1 Tax=Pontibacter sp. G13 TaxID=3074898 RepID=UPI00288A5989|nr:peptidoglycan DD-metalloendopeptidase family protein [Pontibacter sp. G13]WNJ17808.1 peptidoglycan DD-metalloendopeptidase family protein [Pontibacter sp. G13]
MNKPSLSKFCTFARFLCTTAWAIVLLGGIGWAQDMATDRDQLQKELALTDKLLKETEDRRDKTFNELSLLNRQLRLRKRLLVTLTREIDQTTERITELHSIICALEEDIVSIQEEYAKTAALSYKGIDSDNFWISVLGADNFQDMYARAVYFQQFSEFRKRQVELIRQTQVYLEEKTELLTLSLTAKEELILQKQSEMARLRSTKSNQQAVYQDLKQKVSSYQSQLDEQREQLKNIIKAAENTILTEAGEIEEDYGAAFKRNRGFMPWPVRSSKGIIVGTFGVTEDPYGNRITNDGIFIRTPQGETVRAVHSGTIMAVQRIPMSGSMVIIEHGDFRTVYANLDETFVEKGEQVSANQQLGKVRTDVRTGETLLNFLVLRVPDTFLDPEKWIIDPS